MSQGPFDIRFYEADSGEKHVIRIQPETIDDLSIGGAPVPGGIGPATSPFWAKVTRGAREYGLRPRFFNVRWTGSPPSGYAANETLSIPILNSSAYAGATVGLLVSYLGSEAKIVSKTDESIYPGI